MTIQAAVKVWPAQWPILGESALRGLEQMLDRGDACVRGLPYRGEHTHLVQTKCGEVYLITAGK